MPPKNKKNGKQDTVEKIAAPKSVKNHFKAPKSKEQLKNKTGIKK